MAETISPTTQKLFDSLAPKNEEKKVSKDMDKDAFLKLMIEQMKAQNPLNPSGGYEQMAAQLAQYTSLEQLQNLNTTMTSLLQSNTSLVQSVGQQSLPAMMGKTVRANANGIGFDGSNSVQFGYELPLQAGSLKLSIKDSAGNVVRVLEPPSIGVRSGENSVMWDGRDSKGATVPKGAYTFEMEGKDLQGKDLRITPMVRGTVTGVRYRENGAFVVLNGAEIPAGSITELLN
ncbi:MAG: hypothetical protein JNL32_00785 [Candidatus Kapabacteria bacterium]|nr:hypothetical protein [Candidatus Kapabacteria bacterium]